MYSKSQDGGYCLPCVLFSPGSQTAGNRGVLVRTPFKRWTKVSDVCRGHEQLKYHLDAQVAFEAFKSNMIRPEKSVASQLDGQRAEHLRKNQELIKSIAKTVHFCGKQGIALRGHRDDSTATSSSNRGNFRELLDFRAEAGDEHLQDHFKSRQGNAMYSSKTIQNQLIEVIEDQVRSRIIDSVQASRYFSILCDEVTDVSGMEQLSLVLRFVDQSNSIREEFVDFVQVERITGEVLASSILNKIESYGLDIRNCRGQGYDGASNMSSAVRGVQGIIRQSSPTATYIHCNAHVLNLAIVSSCSLPPIRNMAGNVMETAKFFNFSPKRQRLFEKVILKN